MHFYTTTPLNTKSARRTEGGRVGEGVCDHDVMIQMIDSEAADQVYQFLSRCVLLQ